MMSDKAKQLIARLTELPLSERLDVEHEIWRGYGQRLQEAPAAVKLIWKKLPPSTRSKVTLDQLQDFLGYVMDDGETVKQAAKLADMATAIGILVWSDVEKTGMV